MKNKTFFYQRRFLNKKKGRAYSIAKVSKYEYGYVEVFLELGDCTKDMCLEFGFDITNKKEYTSQLKKLDDLIKTCNKLRKAMVKDNKKDRKAAKKKNK